MTTDAVIPRAHPQWETVCEEHHDVGHCMTRRLVVPGGWLYRMIMYTDFDLPPAIAMTFVPKL